jgi:hypothetical protein
MPAFVPDRPFHPGLMFESKATAYLCKDLSVSPLQGRLLVLPTNIRLGSKSLPGTNTLAYDKKMINYSHKNVYVYNIVTGDKVIKPFL